MKVKICISNSSRRIEEAILRQEKEEKKDDRKGMFPLVSVLVRHEAPGNYTCTIPLPRNCSLFAQFGTSFRFLGPGA